MCVRYDVDEGKRGVEMLLTQILINTIGYTPSQHILSVLLFSYVHRRLLSARLARCRGRKRHENIYYTFLCFCLFSHILHSSRKSGTCTATDKDCVKELKIYVKRGLTKKGNFTLLSRMFFRLLLLFFYPCRNERRIAKF